MLKLKQIVISRTIWTLAFMILWNGWNATDTKCLNPHIVELVDGVLGLVAMYFRAKPIQVAPITPKVVFDK